MLKVARGNTRNKSLEHVNEYKYLGIYFRSSGVFTQGIKYLCNKALKKLSSVSERP